MVWTYGSKLWGTTYNSNIVILQRVPTKVLKAILNASCYFPNYIQESNLKIPSMKKVIRNSAKINQLLV